MKRFINLWLLISLIIIGMLSCSYDSEDELYGTSACSTTNISYAGDVLPLLVDNCYVCHDAQNNFGNVTLEGYNNTKIYIDNERLIGAITHSPGFAQMPNGQPKLLICQIEKIQSWVADGAPNN